MSASLKNYRLPISIRLTLWYGMSMLVLLGLFGGMLLTAFHLNQHAVLHQRLFQAQTELMPTVRLEDGRVAVTPPLQARGGSLQIEGAFGTYARLLSPQGEVWDQSPNFRGAPAFAPQVPDHAHLAEIDFEWQQVPIRSFYAPLFSNDEVVGWLEVSGYAWNARLHLLGGSVVLAVIVTVALALLGGYLLARRALKPVVHLTDAANRITPSELGIRLPTETRFRDELTDLAETFNTMLDRLEASFERERRFTADAAHEILNPLAALRNEAEVALLRPEEHAMHLQSFGTIVAEAQRLGHLVEQLLDLARLDAVDDVPREPVDLRRLCIEHLAVWTPLSEEQHLRLNTQFDEQALVSANAVHLGAVLHNLLDNAFKYTPEGGRVEVSLETSSTHAALSISDTGCGFAPEAASRLFDRFHRTDAPEVQAHPGSGLGLAIVRALVQAYGGTITAASDGPGQGSRFIVTLPLAPPE